MMQVGFFKSYLQSHVVRDLRYAKLLIQNTSIVVIRWLTSNSSVDNYLFGKRTKQCSTVARVSQENKRDDIEL